MRPESSVVSVTRRLMAGNQLWTPVRRFRFWAGAWLLLLLFYCITGWVGIIRWHTSAPNNSPKSSAFLRVSNSDTYLYSAISNMAPQGAPDSLAAVTGGSPTRASSNDPKSRASQSYRYIVEELQQDLEIVITGLDRSRSWPSSFVCCVKLGEGSDGADLPIFATTAASYYQYTQPLTWRQYIKEFWLSSLASLYVVTQYSCRIPRRHLASSRMPVYATVAPMPSHLARILPITPLLLQAWPWTWLRTYQGYCPKEKTQYLPVEYPVIAPGDLGICSKISHSHPDAELVLEWMELQRHLGVDRVVVYDMGDNSEELKRVFEHYEKTDFLERKAYGLPGKPSERSLDESHKRTPQFNQDETLAVLECRLRLSGHGIVLSIDKDEVLVPRRDEPLKLMLKNLFLKHPNAPSLSFPTQFFITTWLPSNPEEDVLFLRYRRTRIARWECWKYAFLPNRVRATFTHFVLPFWGFSEGDRISRSEAILHHYRRCPRDVWGTCDVSSTTDHTMLRYKKALVKEIGQVKRDIALTSQPSAPVKP